MARKISDFEILTKTLFFECGSTQEIFDVLMVGWVIRNRVKKGGVLGKWFGNTYERVCLKKWQFSCWNGKDINEIKKIEWGNNNFRWAMCRMAAAYIIEAPESHNPIPKVYYYYNPMLVSPKWARNMKMVTPLLRLDHIFMKK